MKEEPNPRSCRHTYSAALVHAELGSCTEAGDSKVLLSDLLFEWVVVL